MKDKRWNKTIKSETIKEVFPKKEVVKKKAISVKSNEIKAKELAKQGLNTKQIGNALGINKYDASKLIKGC